MEKIRCSICSTPLSLRRENRDDPPEYEECELCRASICIECVDWNYMVSNDGSRIICKKCSEDTLELVFILPSAPID